MKLRLVLLIAAPTLGIALYLTCPRLFPQENGRGAGAVLPQNRVASSDSKGDDVTPLKQNGTSLQKEVTSPTERLALLGQRIPRQGPSTSAIERPADADPQSIGLAREQAVEARRARIAAIEDSFRSQSFDPTWSANTSALIRNTLNRDDVGHIQADNIECRSDSCRVELHGDGSGRLEKALPILALQLAGALPRITVDNITQPDGSSTRVLYMFSKRDGG